MTEEIHEFINFIFEKEPNSTITIAGNDVVNHGSISFSCSCDGRALRAAVVDLPLSKADLVTCMKVAATPPTQVVTFDRQPCIPCAMIGHPGPKTRISFELKDGRKFDGWVKEVNE